MCEGKKCSLNIMSLLRKIQGSLNCSMQSNAEIFGLTTSQFMVMFEIYNNQGISLNELSERLDLPKSSVSRLVDQLVNAEIVIREIPKENRRTIKLSISLEFLKKRELCDIVSGINDSIVSDLEPQKADEIISALEEFISVIKSRKNN